MARLKRPLDEEAIAKADDEFYAKHPEFIQDGKRIPLSATDPAQADLRREWIELYQKYEGEVEDDDFNPKDPEDPIEPCPKTITVSAKIVSVTFRSDHMDDGEKLLKRSGGGYKDNKENFLKPEWSIARGGASSSHPISQTKATKLKLDVEIDFTVEPEGCSVPFISVYGYGGSWPLRFQKNFSRSVSTERVTVTDIVAEEALPNHVDLLKTSIDWQVYAKGEWHAIGSSGKHRIYVTFDRPHGKMAFDSKAYAQFVETGAGQDVTEDRLRFSVKAARGTGSKNEKECVDAVFKHLMDTGVRYDLDYSWGPEGNETGMSPKPTLHHYLWRCNGNLSQGQCHNIAAAFILACRILGVKGHFEIGYMYPWPSRKDNHPFYKRRGDLVMGRYNDQYKRNHSDVASRRTHSVNPSTGKIKKKWTWHGDEILVFVDGQDNANVFEGVAKYESSLYAIGEGVYDDFATDHENASSFFAEGDDPKSGRGATALAYLDLQQREYCNRPYPFKFVGEKYQTGRSFWWEQ